LACLYKFADKLLGIRTYMSHFYQLNVLASEVWLLPCPHAQLYCVGFHIFKCVGYFIFICLKDSSSLLFFLPFFQVFTHCMFPSVGWVKYEILLFAVDAIFGTVIFLCLCIVFFLLFYFVVVVSLQVCLSAFCFFAVCSVLLSVVYFV
jgi:hypothetical protein